MAQIGWIDFSEADRKKMKQAMSLIRPEGQVDELGIGTIRNGIANNLFPGISTIQTRAKYFFIIPYIMWDYCFLSSKEKERTTGVLFLEDKQQEIKNIFREKFKEQKNTGIIGITLPYSKRSSRMPADIYWVGLNTFKCLDSEGLTMNDFLRNLNHLNFSSNSNSKKEEMDDDLDAGIDLKNPINVPKASNNWKQNLDINLNFKESEFLKNALSDSQNPALENSVFLEIFHLPALMEFFLNSKNFEDFSRSACSISNLDPELKRSLILAHDFSEVIHGAHIFYNHLLQQHLFPEAYENKFLREWQDWYENLPEKMLDFENFKIEDYEDWTSHGKYFLNEWWKLIGERKSVSEMDMAAMIQLIKQREFVTKGKKARLQNSIQLFDDVKLNIWIGLRPLQYRFRNAQRIIKDILNPKENV